MTTEETWIDTARQIAAVCWEDEETRHIEMDKNLVEAVAKRIAVWMELVAQNSRDKDYYRGLLVKCGEAIGERAYIQDDGGKSEDVLYAKIPEIIESDYQRAEK